MSLNKAGGKYQKKSCRFRRRQCFIGAAAAFIAAWLAGGAAMADSGQRGLTQPQRPGLRPAAPAEAPVRESDLRAFCPPAEFADSAYAYRIYAGGALKLQAAIADITRDCRYDEGAAGMAHLHIAAAGRAVPASMAARGAVTLPIAVKISRGDKIIFAKTYQQPVSLAQGTAQFLFSQWVALKKAEIADTKITIGFGAAGPGRPGGGDNVLKSMTPNVSVPYREPDEWARARAGEPPAEREGPRRAPGRRAGPVRPQPPMPPAAAAAESQPPGMPPTRIEARRLEEEAAARRRAAEQRQPAAPAPIIPKSDLLAPKAGGITLPEQF